MKDPLSKASSVGADINTKLKIDTLLVEGTFFAPSGYGSSTREFIHHFIEKYSKNFLFVQYFENPTLP